MHYPHTNTAPMRPTAAHVMRNAIAREDARKAERRDAVLTAANHAIYFVLIVLGTVAASIN